MRVLFSHSHGFRQTAKVWVWASSQPLRLEANSFRPSQPQALAGAIDVIADDVQAGAVFVVRV